jgi:hypothetical protein
MVFAKAEKNPTSTKHDTTAITKNAHHSTVHARHKSQPSKEESREKKASKRANRKEVKK